MPYVGPVLWKPLGKELLLLIADAILFHRATHLHLPIKLSVASLHCVCGTLSMPRNAPHRIRKIWQMISYNRLHQGQLRLKVNIWLVTWQKKQNKLQLSHEQLWSSEPQRDRYAWKAQIFSMPQNRLLLLLLQLKTTKPKLQEGYPCDFWTGGVMYCPVWQMNSSALTDQNMNKM